MYILCTEQQLCPITILIEKTDTSTNMPLQHRAPQSRAHNYEHEHGGIDLPKFEQ